MKKTIISLILLILIPSIYFGGEKIAGFNFGGVLKNYKDYEEPDIKKIFDHVYHTTDVKFFDYAEIETDSNHVIKSLVFVKFQSSPAFSGGCYLVLYLL